MCYFITGATSHRVLALLLLMASSNFKQPTVKDRKCSMKFPQHELTVHNNNETVNISQNVGPNELKIKSLFLLGRASNKVS
jgi:hypothetical protein